MHMKLLEFIYHTTITIFHSWHIAASALYMMRLWVKLGIAIACVLPGGVNMRLIDYQRQYGLTKTQLAKLLGVTWAQLHRWLTHQGQPCARHWRTIESVTQGEVTVRDGI